MAYVDPRYLECQRKRFTRNNAHLYIRHDAWRFAPPGSPRYSGKEVVRYFEPEPSDNLGRTGERKHASLPAEGDWRGDPDVQRIVAEMKQDIRELLLHYKYDPDQPRVPAGNPGGGQWTSDDNGPDNGQSSDLSAARRNRALEAICLAQYARDTFHCTMVGSRACHAQAAERFAACLARKPIPPLNY